MKPALPVIGFAAALFASACTTSGNDPDDPHIASLADLSVNALRERTYGSRITIEERVNRKSYESFRTSYLSDGLRVYSRFDIPSSPMPPNGYPVVIFLHGWLGIEGAPALDFYYSADSNYGEMIDAYVDAGFVVFTPGWRGHGTVGGVPADGIEFIRAWDNGSYLSPVFYAIDVLNLLDSLTSVEQLNLNRVNLVAHSQGGDVALIALAVAGEGSRVKTAIAAASIWSGTFPSRFTQLQTYWPMETTTEAFFSGDGNWNGTAVGRDGSVNPYFVFGYPADWIGTVDKAEWTWQHDTWSLPTVLDAQTVKLDQMYETINKYVDGIDDARYVIAVGDAETFKVGHDSRIVEAMNRIGAFSRPQFLTEPLALQHSDRDFYSFPAWNADLCERIKQHGGRCYDFGYAGNTHSLRVSEHRWFSGENSVPGFYYAVQRDIALFRGSDPSAIAYP